MPPLHQNPHSVAKRPRLLARLFHGTGAGAVGYGLGIATNLLLLPLYLRAWSVPVYGEWMALYSVVNYLGSLDFGITTAAVNAATIAYARQDWPAFKRIQGTAWAASLAIAAAGGLATALLAAFYFHLDAWLGLRSLGHQESRLVICGLAVSLLANIPGRQLTAIFCAAGAFATYQWLNNAYTFISFLATAVALAFGARPVTLALVLAAATIATIVYSLILLSRKGSQLLPHLSDADWHTARTLSAPTGQVGISMFASALTVQGPVIVLSRMLGGPAVALFTTTRTITNAVRAVIVLLRAPLRPEFGAASAQSNKDALARLFRVAVSVDTVVALTLSATLWTGGIWLIQFWSHRHILPDAQLLHLLLVSVVIEGFLQILTVVGWATNKIKGVSVGLLITAVTSLIFAVALVGRFGPSAIPIGTLIPLVILMAPIALRNAASEAHIPMRYVLSRILLPFLAVSAASVGLLVWLARFASLPWWFIASLSTLSVFVLSTCICAVFYLTQKDRLLVADRLANLFRRKVPDTVPATKLQEQGLASAHSYAEPSEMVQN